MRFSLKRLSLYSVWLSFFCAMWAQTANAQTISTPPTNDSEQAATQSPGAAGANTSNRATPTVFGDTGLWFVPTGEVLKDGQWSVSSYRRGTNYSQGFSNVSDLAGTFAVGVKDRTEIFGSFLFDTRIERDLRPLFTGSQEVCGVIDRYPRIHQGWTGDAVGDLYLGAKFNLRSEARQNWLELALRGVVKVVAGLEET